MVAMENGSGKIRTHFSDRYLFVQIQKRLNRDVIGWFLGIRIITLKKTTCDWTAEEEHVYGWIVTDGTQGVGVTLISFDCPEKLNFGNDRVTALDRANDDSPMDTTKVAWCNIVTPPRLTPARQGTESIKFRVWFLSG